MDDTVISTERIKRRLPVWMLGDQARNNSETVNSSKIEEDDDEGGSMDDEEKVKKRGRRPKLKSRQMENDDGSLKLEEESSSLLIKCREKKRNIREMVSQEVDVNCEIAVQKKNRKGRVKRSLVVEKNEKFEDYAENGEDEDLTVDDLMSIAKEFVQEDEDAQPVVFAKHEHREGTQSQNIESRCSVAVPQGNIISFEDRMTSSCSSVENLTSEIAGCKQTFSGNPTQDMLDLFLGPLLKKTQEQEKEGVLVAEEINFTHEVKKQPSGVVLGEEPAVVMKKKTSLKDKVAMFLD